MTLRRAGTKSFHYTIWSIFICIFLISARVAHSHSHAWASPHRPSLTVSTNTPIFSLHTLPYFSLTHSLSRFDGTLQFLHTPSYLLKSSRISKIPSHTLFLPKIFSLSIFYLSLFSSWLRTWTTASSGSRRSSSPTTTFCRHPLKQSSHLCPTTLFCSPPSGRTVPQLILPLVAPVRPRATRRSNSSLS